VLLIENEELLSYYTTPQTNNQAKNAGKSRENPIFPADFLPGACRTGGEDKLLMQTGIIPHRCV